MKLGLPLEYKKIPEFFDSNQGDNEYKNNEGLEKILKKHNVKNILDLTCGTGNQVFFLANLGYKIIGSDFSPKLLEIARLKAKNRKLELQFFDGDMRISHFGEFDAVITMFNAVGHVSKKDFIKTMKNVLKNLKDGGIYVFDIFNLTALTKEVVKDFYYQEIKTTKDSTLLHSQASIVEANKKLLTSYDTYVLQKNVEKPKNFHNKFSLRIYDAKELKEMLLISGFKEVEFYALDGSNFQENKTVSLLTLAKK
jgi:ubiquinone/menaquinone biosynthesis C-methylase UbiE